MLEGFVSLLRTNVGVLGSVVALAACVAAAPFCIRKKRWPEIGEIVVLGFTAAGVVSGLKIAVLTLWLDSDKLGPLADDKSVLFIGGAAAFYASLREAIANWRKVAGI